MHEPSLSLSLSLYSTTSLTRYYWGESEWKTQCGLVSNDTSSEDSSTSSTSTTGYIVAVVALAILFFLALLVIIAFSVRLLKSNPKKQKQDDYLTIADIGGTV